MAQRASVAELKNRLAVQTGVAEVLAKAPDQKEATKAFLDLICNGLGWDWGAMWEVDSSADVLRLVETSCRLSHDVDEFEQLTRRLTLARGQGVPGIVWESGKPHWIDDVAQFSESPRAAAAGRAGLHTMVGFPIGLKGKVLGVMEFAREAARGRNPDLMRFLDGLGSQIGQYLERKRVEAALRESQESLADAQGITHLGSWDWRPPTGELRWSDEVYRIFGYSPGEVTPTYERFLSLIYPDDRAKVDLAVKEAIAGTREYRIDHRLTRPDGEVRVVYSRGRAIFDAHGHAIRMIGTIEDATERARAQDERERLLAHEQALARIGQSLAHEMSVPSVVDAIVDQTLDVLGADFVAVWLADPAKRELTLQAYRGKSPTTVRLLRHLSYDAPLASARAAATGQPQVIEETQTASDLPPTERITRGEGARTVLAMPLFSRGGLVGVVTYAWRDPKRLTSADLEFNTTVANLFAVVISNASLNDRVRETLRLREEFMASAAHELRTPVTVIKGGSQFALKVDARDEMSRRTFETVIRQSDRITAVIEDLLNVMRLGPGRLPVAHARFDLSALAHEVVERTARSIEPGRIKIETAGPIIVESDMRLVERILARLIDNALRYSPPAGTVEVATTHHEREGVVSVTDHGVGIPRERQPHVFEPFYEPVPAGTTGYVGIVSLGLYLSKQILDELGGRIWLKSSPGEGSTFSFGLPLVDEELPPSPADLK